MAMHCVFDHLVVTAPALDAGVAWVERTLCVSMGAGGSHPRMGTHNRLLRLGDSAFIEVIAIDPEADSPARPRWFGLDKVVPSSAPRLAAWVARTEDLRAWPAATVAPLGQIETMTRGEREWLITVAADGASPMESAAPALIEWCRPRHSAAFDLADAGCTLVAFEIRHPDPSGLQALLAGLGLAGVAAIVRGAPALRAVIDTPGGTRILGGFD